MPALGFRWKLLLATMAVVGGVTAATLLATQHSVDSAYRAVVQEQFESEVTRFDAQQEGRLAIVKTRSLDVAGSVRLVAGIEEGDPTLVYRIALDELRDVLRPDPHAPDARPASFFRLVIGDAVVPPPDTRAGLAEAGRESEWEAQIARVARALDRARRQDVGFLAPRIEGEPALHEVVVTRVADPLTERTLGALAIGFPTVEAVEPTIRSGIWLEDRLYGRAVPASVLAALPRRGGDGVVRLDGTPYRVFVRPIHADSKLPLAYRVGLYSMADALAEQRALRRRILGFAALALVAGLALSLLLARGLSGPLEAVVSATGEIRRGNLAVRVPVRSDDELGRLAVAFNDMAGGLALKERYRSVLDVVTDRDVAQQLVEGRLTLGGELRTATVLFCDIRGFTTLTEGMPPEEVIALLNEHMTAMTRVVYAQGGIVDKFVGDALMAVFGVPRSTGDDAANAVEAARRMIAERETLSRTTSRHPMAIGIGIASGTVLAGCVGAADRLNYTVLGERVNLAARLCAQAAPGEVLLDEATCRGLDATVRTEPLPPLTLKGFSAAVVVYRLAPAGPLASAV